MKRFFIDTEFIESGAGKPIQLISIGIVAEDGRKYYAISRDYNSADANQWVKDNVLPGVESQSAVQPKTLAEIKADILNFIVDSEPQFWGYYADYDWVVFCQIFGTMSELPAGWPLYCRDIKQFCDDLGNPKLPEQSSLEHNALNDAEWNKIAFDYLCQQRDSKKISLL